MAAEDRRRHLAGRLATVAAGEAVPVAASAVAAGEATGRSLRRGPVGDDR